MKLHLTTQDNINGKPMYSLVTTPSSKEKVLETFEVDVKKGNSKFLGQLCDFSILPNNLPECLKRTGLQLPSLTGSLIGKAYSIMFRKIRSASDSNLRTILDSINLLESHKEDSYPILVGTEMVRLPFDDWAQAIYSELEARGLKK